LLRLFGARIGKGVHAYPSSRIWAPWNLQMADHSCLGDYVDCYCVDQISLGEHAVVSQYSYLCTGSHDYTHSNMPLTTAPIVIGARAWVAADVFVGPGVVVGEGAVIGARATVIRDIDPWVVAVGNPARKIKDRVLSQ
jgi:putative colanic acid biosynthesis acetyltransferase WcaF